VLDKQSAGPAPGSGGRAGASVSSNADRPLHAAALVHQAVFIELATINTAVTAAQPAVNTSDAGLALTATVAARFIQVYFHGCSICSVLAGLPTLLMRGPALQMSVYQNCPATIRNPCSTRFGIFRLSKVVGLLMAGGFAFCAIDQGGGKSPFLLHCLVNRCPRFLVCVLLRPSGRLFYTHSAFVTNLGNLIFGEMLNAN